MSFPVGPTDVYDFAVEPLFGNVDTAQSGFNITAYKIEVTLHKAASGLKWSALQGSSASTATTPGGQQGASTAASAPARAKETAPSYPTSSRNGPKNWDDVSSSLLQTRNAKGEVEEYEDGDPLQGFFKQLYGGADADTRRAMMKSYQESNGTALSTNWGEVGKGTVPISPPDGMEAKKW